MFRKAKPDLTKVTWAHAVNSKELLTKTLQDGHVDMLEADVVLGKMKDDLNGPILPIMAHPPEETSDLSLSMFLHELMKFNKFPVLKSKGVKLDFKSIDAFEMSLPLLNVIVPLIKFPLWLNADIIEGPVNAMDCMPVDPDRFLEAGGKLKDVVLSLGWTTFWDASVKDGDYAPKYVETMIKVLQANHVDKWSHTLTFAVRAGIAANSAAEMKRLMAVIGKTNKCSLTIWSAPGDYVNVDRLFYLMQEIGKDKIYLDVTEELAIELKWAEWRHAAAHPDKWSSFTGFAAVAAILIVATALLAQFKF